MSYKTRDIILDITLETTEIYRSIDKSKKELEYNSRVILGLRK